MASALHLGVLTVHWICHSLAGCKNYSCFWLLYLLSQWIQDLANSYQLFHSTICPHLVEPTLTFYCSCGLFHVPLTITIFFSSILAISMSIGYLVLWFKLHNLSFSTGLRNLTRYPLFCILLVNGFTLGIYLLSQLSYSLHSSFSMPGLHICLKFCKALRGIPFVIFLFFWSRTYFFCLNSIIFCQGPVLKQTVRVSLECIIMQFK